MDHILSAPQNQLLNAPPFNPDWLWCFFFLVVRLSLQKSFHWLAKIFS